MAGELTSGKKQAIEQGNSAQGGAAQGGAAGASNPVGNDVSDDAVAQRMRELRGDA